MIHMDEQFLSKVTPIIRDNYGWEAFTLILEYYKDQEQNKLGKPQTSEDLIRINASLVMLNKLLLFRSHAMSALEVINAGRISSQSE